MTLTEWYYICYLNFLEFWKFTQKSVHQIQLINFTASKYYNRKAICSRNFPFMTYIHFWSTPHIIWVESVPPIVPLTSFVCFLVFVIIIILLLVFKALPCTMFNHIHNIVPCFTNVTRSIAITYASFLSTNPAINIRVFHT